MKKSFENTKNSLTQLSNFTFNTLTDNEIELIEENSTVVHFNKGETIFRENALVPHVMFILDGLVQLYKETRNGKRLIIKVEPANTFISWHPLSKNQTLEYSATTLTPCEILQVDSTIFKQIITQNGRYSLHLFDTLSSNEAFLVNRLMSQFQKQLPGRVADVLLYFSEEIYKDISFVLPMNRREVAEFAGTTKESLIRTFTEFKNDKIIALEGNKVEIKSMEILKVLSKLG